jgi:hypothetical protein
MAFFQYRNFPTRFLEQPFQNQLLGKLPTKKVDAFTPAPVPGHERRLSTVLYVG